MHAAVHRDCKCNLGVLNGALEEYTSRSGATQVCTVIGTLQTPNAESLMRGIQIFQSECMWWQQHATITITKSQMPPWIHSDEEGLLTMQEHFSRASLIEVFFYHYQ